mmetsp:Transcript_26208/g.55234  ORF Transcript_26208/g.55234 Transcript_26208/m.55234 type:complete len:256 (+) Transcript_26208:2018-2785(+)
MLNSMTSPQHDTRNAQFQTPQRLTKQIQKVGKIAHARNENRLTIDDDFSGNLLVEKQIVQLPFHGIGHDAFFNFGDSVLFAKIQTLISDEESVVFMKEFLFNATNLRTNVFVGRLVGLDVSEDGLDLSGCGVILVAVGLGEGIFGDPEVGGWGEELFSVKDGANRVIIPTLSIKRIQIFHRIFSQLGHIRLRKVFEARCILGRGKIKFANRTLFDAIAKAFGVINDVIWKHLRWQRRRCTRRNGWSSRPSWKNGR